MKLNIFTDHSQVQAAKDLEDLQTKVAEEFVEKGTTNKKGPS